MKDASSRKNFTKVQGAAVLSVESLRIVRGGEVILDNVSWRVERGEHWVILGANGSGKTSLLSALTALPDTKQRNRGNAGRWIRQD